MSVKKIVPWIIQTLPSNCSLILLLIRCSILYASNSISILFNCKIYLLLHNFSWIWLSTPCLNLEYVSLSAFRCVLKNYRNMCQTILTSVNSNLGGKCCATNSTWGLKNSTQKRFWLHCVLWLLAHFTLKNMESRLIATQSIMVWIFP